MHSRIMVSDVRFIGRIVSNLVYGLSKNFPNINIYIKHNNRMVNAGSILGILSLGIDKDDDFEVICECSDDKFNMICEYIKEYI